MAPNSSVDDLVYYFIFIQKSALKHFSSAELLNRGLHLQQMRQFMLWTNSNIGAVAEHRTRLEKNCKKQKIVNLKLFLSQLYLWGRICHLKLLINFVFLIMCAAPDFTFLLKKMSTTFLISDIPSIIICLINLANFLKVDSCATTLER